MSSVPGVEAGSEVSCLGVVSGESSSESECLCCVVA